MEKINCKSFRKSAYPIFMHMCLHQDDPLTYQIQIATALRKPVTTVNYHITKFKQEGLIDKHLKLTEKGRKAFKFMWENVDKKVLRAHNIQIKFQVIKCPAKFPDCFSKSIYKPLTNKRYRGLKVSFGDFTVMFYSPKKIICVLRDIYADNDEEISSALQLVIPQIKRIIEAEFEGVKLSDYAPAEIQTMHIAVLNSIIAQNYVIKGFTKEEKDFAIDCSKGIPETELTNPANALRDIMKLVGLENYARGLRGRHSNN